jgi:hypothetical protein
MTMATSSLTAISVIEAVVSTGAMRTRKVAASACYAATARNSRIAKVFDPRAFDAARSGRKHAVRAQTINVKRLTRSELETGRVLNPPVEGIERPKTRGDCIGDPRPCPFVSCVHHLYLEVNKRTHSIKLLFPDLEVWELPETCALDVADRGGETLETVGEYMNVTREMIRQIEVRAKGRMLAGLAKVQGGELFNESDGKRHLRILDQALDVPDLDFAETCMDVVGSNDT